MTGWPAAALIRRKRDGQQLDATHYRDLACGIAQGRWSDGQIGAFAMAVAWRGMTAAECRDFTLALRDSGHSLDWRDLPGPVLDKHSTGGVGDCVSLALAPLLVQQLGPASDGLERDWAPPALDVERNYGYAVQWFGMSLVVAFLLIWFQGIKPRLRTRSRSE